MGVDGGDASVFPDRVGQALGPDIIELLARNTGMASCDVKIPLPRLLPLAVHRFVPNGSSPPLDRASQRV